MGLFSATIEGVTQEQCVTWRSLTEIRGEDVFGEKVPVETLAET